MKNKYFIVALAAALLSFMMYSASLKELKQTKLKVIGPQTSQVTPKGKDKKEPQIASTINKAHIKAGSDNVLASQIKQVMDNGIYQVTVQDLTKPSVYADVSNVDGAQVVTKTSKLFLLAAIYYQEQSGKLNNQTAVKITKRDTAKGATLLHKGIAYGITYLRQLMMRGDQTAANALMRKITPAKVTAIVQKLGASHTSVTSSTHAKTTPADCTQLLLNIYQNKQLTPRYSNQFFTALKTDKQHKLTKKLTKQNSALVDDNAAIVLVQDKERSYCIAAWSNRDNHFPKLVQTVDQWFDK